MWIDSDLPEAVAARIEPLCEEGDQLAEKGQSAEAIEKFREAFRLLPTPPDQWVAATWILTAIGDTQYLAGELEAANETFRAIPLSYPGWEESPFIWLRRGQIAFDLENTKLAADCLTSAFMLAGYDILGTVDEKYAAFVLGQLRSPVPPIAHPLARFHRDASAASLAPEAPP